MKLLFVERFERFCRISREFVVDGECLAWESRRRKQYCKKGNLYNGKLMLFLTGEQKLIR